MKGWIKEAAEAPKNMLLMKWNTSHTRISQPVPHADTHLLNVTYFILCVFMWMYAITVAVAYLECFIEAIRRFIIFHHRYFHFDDKYVCVVSGATMEKTNRIIIIIIKRKNQRRKSYSFREWKCEPKWEISFFFTLFYLCQMPLFLRTLSGMANSIY